MRCAAFVSHVDEKTRNVVVVTVRKWRKERIPIASTRERCPRFRVIMGTAADNRPEGKDNLHGSSGQKKRRKGTSGSSPIGNHSSAPSAKDFVETTARFLASFYAQQRSSLRGKACCSAGNRIETNSESRGDRVVEEIVEAPVEGGLHGRNAVCRNRADGEKEQAGITPGDGSGRESHESHDVALCARFFPQLAKRSMEPIGSAKNSSRARGCLTVEDDCDNTGDQGDTGSSIATAGTDERAEETTAPQPSISKDMSKVAGRGNVRNKGKKGKSGKSRRVPPINSRTRGVTARKEGGTGAQKERGDGDEAVSGGDEFLKSFRRAKLRFTVTTSELRCVVLCHRCLGRIMSTLPFALFAILIPMRKSDFHCTHFGRLLFTR